MPAWVRGVLSKQQESGQEKIEAELAKWARQRYEEAEVGLARLCGNSFENLEPQESTQLGSSTCQINGRYHRVRDLNRRRGHRISARRNGWVGADSRTSRVAGDSSLAAAVHLRRAKSNLRLCPRGEPGLPNPPISERALAHAWLWLASSRDRPILGTSLPS
jgi:hypothetical protein